jgi:hypothetical protein
VTLEEMRQDSDWDEAWAYADGKPRSKQGAVPQPTAGFTGEVGPVSIADVKTIVATSEGTPDGDDWVGVFELKDGRFLFLSAGCDYTGWDCQSGGSSWLADSLDALVRFGLTDDARSRLGLRSAS